MERFILHYDGGHAWIEVPFILVTAMKMSVSQYSYRNGDTMYLEEDCDGSEFFFHFRRLNGRDPVLTEHYDGADSPIRKMQHWTGGVPKSDYTLLVKCCRCGVVTELMISEEDSRLHLKAGDELPEHAYWYLMDVERTMIRYNLCLAHAQEIHLPMSLTGDLFAMAVERNNRACAKLTEARALLNEAMLTDADDDAHLVSRAKLRVENMERVAKMMGALLDPFLKHSDDVDGEEAPRTIVDDVRAEMREAERRAS